MTALISSSPVKYFLFQAVSCLIRPDKHCNIYLCVLARHRAFLVTVSASAGLLLCYELPLQTDREGRPINRLLVNRSHGYQQILANLIHEARLSRFLPPLFSLLIVGVLKLKTPVSSSPTGEHSAIRVAPGSPPAPGLERFHEPSFQRCPTGVCTRHLEGDVRWVIDAQMSG